jgi:hypothetical protein
MNHLVVFSSKEQLGNNLEKILAKFPGTFRADTRTIYQEDGSTIMLFVCKHDCGTVKADHLRLGGAEFSSVTFADCQLSADQVVYIYSRVRRTVICK